MSGCKDMRNNRLSIRKQVKAAPLYGVGLSYRTAEPTEFASFREMHGYGAKVTFSDQGHFIWASMPLFA